MNANPQLNQIAVIIFFALIASAHGLKSIANARCVEGSLKNYYSLNNDYINLLIHKLFITLKKNK